MKNITDCLNIISAQSNMYVCIYICVCDFVIYLYSYIIVNSSQSVSQSGNDKLQSLLNNLDKVH